MIAGLAELSGLGYRIAGTRHGRLLLAHPRTGWRISLPAGGPVCDMHRAVLCRGAILRASRTGVTVRLATPHPVEVAALMTRRPAAR